MPESCLFLWSLSLHVSLVMNRRPLVCPASRPVSARTDASSLQSMMHNGSMPPSVTVLQTAASDLNFKLIGSDQIPAKLITFLAASPVGHVTFSAN